LNNYAWLLALALLALCTLSLYFLGGRATTTRDIFYYNTQISAIATEPHQVPLSRERQRNVCATAEEQLQPPYSYDAIALFASPEQRLRSCLLRRGVLYLDLEHAPREVTHNDLTIAEHEIIALLTRALRHNHRLIRRVAISIKGIPYSGVAEEE